MKNPKHPDPDYDYEALRDEREYGFYWYSGLWNVLRPILIGLGALLLVFGLVSTALNKINEAFISPVDPEDTTEVAFTVASGSSLSRVSKNLQEQGLIKNSSFYNRLIW